MTDLPVREDLTADESILCAAETDCCNDEGPFPCGAVSRFQVSRSDGDQSFGINGGSEECCEAHLADAVIGMTDGDSGVHAIVAIRWDPEAPR